MIRALAEDPTAAAAFMPIGELTSAHRDQLQRYFYRRAGIEGSRSWREEYDKHITDTIAAIKDGSYAEEHPEFDRNANAAAAGQVSLGFGGLFGGGAPPPPKPKDLAPETLAELHPDVAKAIAAEYPREGRELFMKAMGDRPAEVDPRTSKLPEGVHEAVQAVLQRRGHLDPATLAQEAARHIGRQRALDELGVKEEEANAYDPVTGELTPKAAEIRRQLVARQEDLRQRGVNPEEIKRVYGAQLHDLEIQEFEAHSSRVGTPWAGFVDTHGDLGTAYQALQAELRGELAGRMAKHYGEVTGIPLRTGHGFTTRLQGAQSARPTTGHAAGTAAARDPAPGPRMARGPGRPGWSSGASAWPARAARGSRRAPGCTPGPAAVRSSSATTPSCGA